MALTADAAKAQARTLLDMHMGERDVLDDIRRYWRGRQTLPAVVPSSAPREVGVMARIARVNVCSIVVDTLAQSLYVDGFRGTREEADAEVWTIWQANKMDARQTGIHRAAAAYGASYAVVLPGDPLPVIRGASPRNLLAVYGEDPDWPMWALERLNGGPGDTLWRLYDEEAIYYLSGDAIGQLTFVETREHGLGVVPVVRYLDEDDLDAEDDVVPESRTSSGRDVPMRGQVAPLMALQDQVDLTTFGLLVAQWYSAFRQRYAIGWVAEDEKEKAKAAASQLWTFDEDPKEMQVGEFGQTDLTGYIKSRESALQYAATLSQTPVHELTGALVNLSAEALVAAEKGRDRKVDERKSLNGESHEQTLQLAGDIGGIAVPDDAQVVWRDTSARAFSATVDALGKLVQMLGVPPEELWERIPGVTHQDIARWKATAGSGNAFDQLTSMLDRQASGVG